MHSILRTEPNEESVLTSQNDVRLEENPDSAALQREDARPAERPRAIRPGERWKFAASEEVMAASVPGSEYWLP
jgi:hypothetical protein